MKVLITGAAGAIGSVLTKGLQTRHDLRGFDNQPMPDLQDAIVGDITDFELVKSVVTDMDAIIHLVNVPGGEWDHSLQNMIGTYNVFEAAHQCEVARIAYASRAGILPQSFYPRTMQRTTDMLPKPESYYTITKVFGESMGYMYSARYDMEVVSVRIGNFNAERDQPEHPHHLSHGDCVRVFEQAICHPDVNYEMVFGVSDSDWPLYDLEHGRQVIGYHPLDQSQVSEDDRK